MRAIGDGGTSRRSGASQTGGICDRCVEALAGPSTADGPPPRLRLELWIAVAVVALDHANKALVRSRFELHDSLRLFRTLQPHSGATIMAPRSG